jgi:hypothetical protein
MESYLDENEYNDQDNFSDSDDLDNFLNSNSDNIYCLYEDLQNSFWITSPVFLCNMRFHHLINFFCDLILYKKSNYISKSKFMLKKFHNVYKDELQISYDTVYKFLKFHFRYNINYETWLSFCYHLSEKYEIVKGL